MEQLSKNISIIKVLKQVMDTVRQNIGGHFKGMNLTGSQGMVLGTLAHHGEMMLTDLSKKLGLSNSTVSGIVDRLEEQRLVERTRSKEDRRVVYIRVTDEYAIRAKENLIGIEKMFEGMMDKATPEELDVILKGLATLKKVMDRQRE